MSNTGEPIIRWGIWGTGAIASQVASDFPILDGEAVIEAVASRSLDRARRFASRFRVPHFYCGLEPLVHRPEIDAVYISSPNHCHLPDSLTALGAGKAVLCEKPFALNFAEARQIAETARNQKVFCMEAMWTRFVPAIKELKRLLDAGTIGAIRLMQGNFAHPDSPGTASRLFDLAAGGGVLLDRGVYLISLAHYLLGTPRSIHGTAVLGETGVDEQSAYQLSFEAGALTDFAASFKTRATNEVNIFGEHGAVKLCEPFFCPHRLVVRQYNAVRSITMEEVEKSPGQFRDLAEKMRSDPRTKLFVRKLAGPLSRLRQRSSVRSFPFPGNGYQFELHEVNCCLRERKNESAIMPLDQSLEVMETMDTLRAQFGLVYPQEQPTSRKAR